MANSLHSLAVFITLGLISTPIILDARAPSQAPAPPTRFVPPVPPDVAAPPDDAQKTDSGLAFTVLTEGSGTTHPTVDDVVSVHYSGWTTDGKLFDSSLLRGRPGTFAVSRVFPGWSEGVQLMVVGEKRRFWIPEELAFKGVEGRPQGMVVFEIELLEITPPPTPPADVAGPPADAERDRSGLAWKVLKPGTGTDHPRRASQVRVHYTGWTTDGQMFDSSVMRGEPATFRLSEVIEGWTEGVQMMVEGERRRFWIPERLAYQGQQGRPSGMLVFDIELIEIEKQ